jgi:hypothetical protein
VPLEVKGSTARTIYGLPPPTDPIRQRNSKSDTRSNIQKRTGTTPCGIVIGNIGSIAKVILAQKMLFGASCETAMVHF